MKKDRKYIFFLSAIFGVYIWVQLTATRQHNWALSLDYSDKEPYGAVALHRLLPALFPGGVKINSKTFYELKDSLKPDDNLFVLAQRFEPGKEDIGALLAFAEKGHHVFLSAESFGQKLQDTLHFEAYYNFMSFASFKESDSLYVRFMNETLKMDDTIYFKTINIQNRFSKYSPDSASVFVKSQQDDVLTLRVPWGKGQIFLNTTPAAFTNIYAVRQNQQFIAASLSPLPPTRLIWLENYQVGHRELATPLRFILTNDPLSWAYYLTVFSILAFMIFEAKRKQRPIPVVTPLTNTSLEFAGTIGNLYFQRGDHKNIIEKRIHFLFDHIRTHFYLHGTESDFIDRLAKKAGKPTDQITALMSGIHICQQAKSISVNDLSALNKKIEDFYGK